MVIPLVLIAWAFLSAQDSPPRSQEYYIKAAFICQMIKFVTWPKDKPVDANDVITISVIGPNRFGRAFDLAEALLPRDKTLVVKEFKLMEAPPPDDAIQQALWVAHIQALRTSHMIYISGAPKEDVRPLFMALQPAGVLTLGESERFVDNGGMINFLPEEQKVRFEVNLIAVHAAGIQVSSKVLRLASRVISKQEEPPPG